MQETRKSILDRFQDHLHMCFESFCDRHNLEKTQNQFITYMIDQELISLPHLQRFTVLKEFEQIKTEQQYPKTLLVVKLAHRFQISERTVWGILRYSKSDKK